MAIFFEELKQGLKAFIFWMIGLGFLMFAGMEKFSAMAADPQAINALFASWPKAVMAMFGGVGLDITTLSGYFGMMWMYAALVIAVYAIGLGVRLTTLEVSEKNTDFVYAKPKSRTSILLYKTAAHLVYIVAFAAASYGFTIGGIALSNAHNDVQTEVLLLSIALIPVALIYYAIAAWTGAVTAKHGGLIAYIMLLATYLAGIFYDIATKGTDIIRIFAPFKYFNPAEVIANGSLNVGYTAFGCGIALITLVCAYALMARKDF
ncbi:MAG: ABC transporter permease [Coriobacteriia bacterium]|nr:ABC transporter permease [Coriobacteriia bacterium]